MNAEIKSGENLLDEATKWVYADEKGVQVFALYGIGDGTDATNEDFGQVDTLSSVLEFVDKYLC